MQGCPRHAGDDGLLWEFLSQVGLWGHPGTRHRCLGSLVLWLHGRVMGEDTGLVPTVSGNEGLEDLIPVAVFCVRPLAIGGAENVLMNKEEK